MRSNIFENKTIIKEGTQGRPGLNGKDGAKGDPGKDGRDGKDGKNIKGDKGDSGHTGPTGPIGPIGIEGPIGPKGEFGGPTGEQGLQGVTGPIGPTGGMSDHIISIIYNDVSFYKLKCMQDCQTININTNVYMLGTSLTGINLCCLYNAYMTNVDKYIINITITKNNYKLLFYINTSYAVKSIMMTTSGQPYSLPIQYTYVDMITEYYSVITFDFDSQEALDEYLHLGVLYDIYINWF